jgi:ABC-type transporter Mla maintaining outer membrane lipid asymmetry ATPase subunit MlaF
MTDGDDRPLLRIKSLVTGFGSQVIRDQLDLTVDAGEILGLIGGSDSGKTLQGIVVMRRDAVTSGDTLLERRHLAVAHAGGARPPDGVGIGHGCSLLTAPVTDRGPFRLGA